MEPPTMAGVNKAILVGNLGRDPEMKQTPNGQAVVNFTLATSESIVTDSALSDSRVAFDKPSKFHP